jgi:hypothetical protein
MPQTVGAHRVNLFFIDRRDMAGLITRGLAHPGEAFLLTA